jgi:hypothetical protein
MVQMFESAHLAVNVYTHCNKSTRDFWSLGLVEDQALLAVTKILFEAGKIWLMDNACTIICSQVEQNESKMNSK